VKAIRHWVSVCCAVLLSTNGYGKNVCRFSLRNTQQVFHCEFNGNLRRIHILDNPASQVLNNLLGVSIHHVNCDEFYCVNLFLLLLGHSSLVILRFWLSSLIIHHFDQITGKLHRVIKVDNYCLVTSHFRKSNFRLPTFSICLSLSYSFTLSVP